MNFIFIYYKYFIFILKGGGGESSVTYTCNCYSNSKAAFEKRLTIRIRPKKYQYLSYLDNVLLLILGQNLGA